MYTRGMPITRRRFLYTSPLTVAPWWLQACSDDGDADDDAASPFLHGVASGDPLPNAVVIWTRVSAPSPAPQRFAVGWVVATDPELQAVVAAGSVETGESIDYTAKVDVDGLAAGQTYYYQFEALGQRSVVGRTRTPREQGVERLRFAVASCSNYPFGYFNAYAAIARRADLDAVLHLGDYIYEYANGDYGDGAPLGREPEPVHETLSLSDYRVRHAQYKTDPDLQEAHRQHPFIVVWDDHETSNNAWQAGAENHQPEEGDFAERKAAALQAYFEWMPIRAEGLDNGGRICRSFRFGGLADLVMLDTRLLGRDQQPADPCDAASLAEPSRQLLGEEQEAWAIGELASSQASGTHWRLVGQQVMMAQLVNVLLPGACVFSTDQWDGYAAARARLLQAFADNGIGNVVILTGDIHSSWGNDIVHNPFDPALYDAATGSGSLAVEFVAPAVTSPGIGDPDQALALADALLMSHPHVKFVELNRRGYLLLDVTPERVQGEWYHVDTIAERSAGEALAGALMVQAGENHLMASPGASTPRPDVSPLAPVTAVSA